MAQRPAIRSGPTFTEVEKMKVLVGRKGRQVAQGWGPSETSGGGGPCLQVTARGLWHRRLLRAGSQQSLKLADPESSDWAGKRGSARPPRHCPPLPPTAPPRRRGPSPAGHAESSGWRPPSGTRSTSLPSMSQQSFPLHVRGVQGRKGVSIEVGIRCMSEATSSKSTTSRERGKSV